MRVVLDDEPRRALHRPSIDVLMASAARLYGPGSWASSSPAWGPTASKGLRAIREAGGRDPGRERGNLRHLRHAQGRLEAGVVDRSVPLHRMADEILGRGVESRPARSESAGVEPEWQPRGPSAPRHPADRVFQQEDGLPRHPGRGRARAPSSSRTASWCASFTWDSLARGPAGGVAPRGQAGRPHPEADRDGPRAAHPPPRGPVQLQPDREIPGHGRGPGHRRARPFHAGINPQELLLDLARGSTRTGGTPRRRSSLVRPAGGGAASPGRRSADDVVPPSSRSGPITRPRPEDGATTACPCRSPGRRGREEAPPSRRPRRDAGPRRRRARAPPSSCVDDEEDVRGVLAGLFEEVGYEVVEADGPRRRGQGRPEASARPARTFFLVTDLGMPTSGGSSFQGGFEVVKRLGKMNMRPPVLMMTESLSPALQARARQLRHLELRLQAQPLEAQPQAVRGRPPAFASKLVQDVLPRLDGQRRHGRQAGAEGATAGAAGPRPRVSPPTRRGSPRDFSMLQQRLDELRSPRRRQRRSRSS